MNDFINSTINTKFYNTMQDEHQIVNIIDKEVIVKDIGSIVSGDTNSCLLSFEINRFQDGVDLSDKKIRFNYRNSNGKFYDGAVNVKYNDEIIRFSWLLPYSLTEPGGNVIASIEFYGINEYDEQYSYKTKNFKLSVEKSLGVNDESDESYNNWTIKIENDVETIQNRIGEIEKDIKSLHIPTKLSEMDEDPEHRTVSDSQIDTWNKSKENMQSDWNETNTNSSAFIKNKPHIPKVTNDLTDELKQAYDDATSKRHVHMNKSVLDEITQDDIESWNNKSEFDGNYSSLQGIPDSLPASDVYQWAKQPQKPSYTADEVGALPVGAKIPSKTSDLQNDSGFLVKPSYASVGQTLCVQSINEDGSLILKTQDVTDGITPHIGENNHWYIGDTDTGVTAQGVDGYTPQKGIDYFDGADGITPHIGENGHWWIGDVDTGVNSHGEKGDNGVTPHIGTNNHWYIGETDTGVTAEGADGYTPQKGVDYFDGDNGEPGADGKSAYQYAQEGGYTGTEEEFSKKLAAEYLTEESDPTVPDWAKEPQKPSYTASEVGAEPTGTSKSKVSAHNTAGDAHNDIRELITGLTTRLNTLADSDDTTLDQMSEIVAYIKSNKSLIDAITTSKVSVSEIIDNLTTNVSNKPLSAAQGVALKALIDGITIPDKLPNPQKLTFSGAVTAEYDGSGAVTVVIPEGSGGSGGTVRIEKLSTDTLVELEPNKLYVFPEMGSLTITLATPSDTSIVNEYHFVFQSGSTATTLSIPDTIKVPSGFSVEASKIYEISTLEGCMCVQSWEVTA